jgi:hypothetical protein
VIDRPPHFISYVLVHLFLLEVHNLFIHSDSI